MNLNSGTSFATLRHSCRENLGGVSSIRDRYHLLPLYVPNNPPADLYV